MAQDTYRSSTLTGQVRIDSGEPMLAELVVEQELIRVFSDRATKPDVAWSFTDDAGHWHAFAVGEKPSRWELPTLHRESVPMPCDGSCGGVCGGEGYSVDRYTCRACGQEVEPQWVPDMEAQTVGELVEGLKSWRLKVESYDQRVPFTSGQQVSIRLDAGGVVYFGLGYVGDRHVESSIDGHHVTVFIDGATPLGQRLT